MTFSLRQKLDKSPVLVRVLPFLVFLGLTFFQGEFGSASRYWVYLVKTIVGACLLACFWPLITEMRWKFSWPAVGVGLGVFAVWIGLDGLYPGVDDLLRQLGLRGAESAAAPAFPAWNPLAEFGSNSIWAGGFVIVRILGSSLVVPPLEEVFYRSFLYRYLMRADFQAVALGTVRWVPLLVTASVFGLAHREWLAGILCGFAYQGLVCWKNRLGDAMVAHAVTNFLLGLWVVWKGAWQFW